MKRKLLASSLSETRCSRLVQVVGGEPEQRLEHPRHVAIERHAVERRQHLHDVERPRLRLVDVHGERLGIHDVGAQAVGVDAHRVAGVADVGQQRALLEPGAREVAERLGAVGHAAGHEEGHRVARGYHGAGGVGEAGEAGELVEEPRVVGHRLVEVALVVGVQHEHHHVLVGREGVEALVSGHHGLVLHAVEHALAGGDTHHAGGLHHQQRCAGYQGADAGGLGALAGQHGCGGDEHDPDERARHGDGHEAVEVQVIAIGHGQRGVHEQGLRIAADAQGRHEH